MGKYASLKFPGIIYALGCFVSFIIPTLVPVSPSISESYYYGFSNKVGLGILIVTTLCTIFWVYKNVNIIDSLEKSIVPESKTGIKLFFIFLFTLSFGAIITYLFLFHQADQIFYWGESGYFIRRVYLLEDGLKPYQNFEFAYGSFLLYFPYFIGKLFAIGFEFSYVLSYLVEAFLGYFSLYFICKKISGSETPYKIFALVAAPALIFTLVAGVNYTLFRFATPIFLALWTLSKVKSDSSNLTVPFFIVFLFFSTFVISPETSLTATISFLLVYLYSKPLFFKSLLSCVPGILFILICSMLFEPLRNSFTTLYIFSQGGNNFPWFFSPTIISFFIYIFISVIYTFTKNSFQLNLNNLLVFSIAFLNLPGAMGRCDLGHLYFYGLGFFIISIIHIYKFFSPQLRSIFIILYSTVFIIFNAVGTIITFKPYWLSILYLVITLKSNIFKYDKPVGRVKIFEYTKFIDQLPNRDQKPLVMVSTPLLITNPEVRKKIDFPYFMDGSNNFSSYSKNILIRDIKDHNIILLPKHISITNSFPKLENIIIFYLFGAFPVLVKKNNPDMLNLPVIIEFGSTFNKIELENPHFDIYQRKF